MKTSLGIWAFGAMATRFVPGGYQPQWAGETTVERVTRAVDGLGDLIDGYEFHYPQELSEENLDEVRAALGDRDIYCIATGLHLDPRFGRGGLTSPDEETRTEARRRTVAAADFAGSLGAHFIIWPGSRATTTCSRRRIRRAGSGSSRESARRRSAAASTASSSSSSTRTRSRR